MSKRDHDIFQLINKEAQRQINGLELIASENFVSPQVQEAMGSILTNKYAEGLPGKRYYGGCEIIDEIENLAIGRAKKLFGATWVNVQPHSGSQANAAVMLALLKPGDTILGFNLAHGGHLTHGSSVNFSGKIYRSVFYGVDPKTGYIDFTMVKQKAYQEKPKLIICGASAYSRDWDYEKFRQLADEVGALLLADIAHPAGLIAKGLLKNPLKNCHIITTTTHKTLRGPRGGMIMMGHDFNNPWQIKNIKGEIKKMSTLLDSGVFPGTQGGPLEHIIAAKAVAFYEALQNDFTMYGIQVQKNAKMMAKIFLEKNYKIITGGTDNHLLLIDLTNKKITGKYAENILSKAGITINKNMVPFDPLSPFITSGIRLGTAAITTQGIQEKDIEQIVEWIDKALKNAENNKKLQEIKNNIQQFMQKKLLS